MIVLDTSALYAALVTDDVHHERARLTLEREQPPFVLSPFVLCELDYLLMERLGAPTELALLDEVSAGRYELAVFEREDVAEARRILERHRDLEIGLADASIVVLSRRYGTNRVFSLDERHFRSLRTSAGRPFRLLPADA